MVKGYRVFFNKNRWSWESEKEPSEVLSEKYRVDSWFDTYQHAENSAKELNENLVKGIANCNPINIRIHEMRICKICETPFPLFYGEYEWFDNKNLNTPRTCPKCRLNKKKK